MSTAESIYELVKTLPEEDAGLVLVFAEFIRQRTQSTLEGSNFSKTANFQAVSLHTKGFEFSRDEANDR